MIGEPADDVWDKTRLCGSPGAPPAPRCFNGSPYQPIPVTDEATHRDGAADHGAPRGLPRGHAPSSPPSASTRSRWAPTPRTCSATSGRSPTTSSRPGSRRTPAGRENETVLQRTDLIGRAGLEAQYDDDLRGTPGVKTLAVDHQGGVSGVLAETAADRRQLPRHHASTRRCRPRPRSSCKAAIKRARHTGDINKGYATKLKADSGAVVVMDVQDRRDRRDGQLADVRPEHLGRRHQHQGLQVDHQQEEQLPEPVARVPGRVRAGLDVQGGHRCPRR